MFNFMNGDKGSFLAGFAAGLGTGVTAREVVPAIGSIAAPLFKNTVKAGIMAFEKGRESLAHMGESMQDLVAEARAEMHQRNGAGANQSAEKAAEAGAGE